MELLPSNLFRSKLLFLLILLDIRSHLRNEELTKNHKQHPFSHNVIRNAQAQEEFTSRFKRLFLVTANEIADFLQEPLPNLGILFDEMLRTGTVKKYRSTRTVLTSSVRSPVDQDLNKIESGDSTITFGRGQILFIVRQVTKPSALRLQASGFRFASIANIVDLLARSMEVGKDDIMALLARMQQSVSVQIPTEPCLHLGLFALRPLYHRGFDVLVEKIDRGRIPSVTLPFQQLEKWQMDILSLLDNCSVSAMREKLHSHSNYLDDGGQLFINQMIGALTDLGDRADVQRFEESRLLARPFSFPGARGSRKGKEPTLIVLRLLMTAHESLGPSDKYHFDPLEFFLARQRAMNYTNDHDIFARKIREECGAVSGPQITRRRASSASPQANPPPEAKVTRKRMLLLNRIKQSSANARSFSIYGSMDERGSEDGIMAASSSSNVFEARGSQENNFFSKEQEGSVGRTISDPSSRTFREEGREIEEELTYADELAGIMLSERRQHH